MTLTELETKFGKAYVDVTRIGAIGASNDYKGEVQRLLVIDGCDKIWMLDTAENWDALASAGLGVNVSEPKAKRGAKAAAKETK